MLSNFHITKSSLKEGVITLKCAIGSILFFIFYGLTTLLYLPFAMLYILNIHHILGDLNIEKFFAYFILQFLKYFCGIKVEIINYQTLPQGAIIASEHQSALDIYILSSIAKHPIYMAKESLFKMPIVGTLLRNMGTLPANRFSINKAIQALKSGRTFIIFPEGERVVEGKMASYKKGVFIIAKEAANAPVIPIALETAQCWPLNSFIKRPGIAKIIIGDPIKNRENFTPESLREIFNDLKTGYSYNKSKQYKRVAKN